MSAFSTIFGAIGRPALLAQLGEPVTRYPLGSIENAEAAISGVFEELEPNRNTQDGERVLRRGRLQIAQSETVDGADVWLIRAETWQVVAIESQATAMRTIHVERQDEERTRRNNESRII